MSLTRSPGGDRRRGRRPPRPPRSWLPGVAMLVMAWLAVFHAGAPAWAGPGDSQAPTTPSGAVEAEARRLFAEGKQQLDARDHEGAIRSFQQSYALYPVPGLLYVLAQAHRLKGDCHAALNFYRQYLPSAPDENKLREKTQARIADMERCIAATDRPLAPGGPAATLPPSRLEVPLPAGPTPHVDVTTTETTTATPSPRWRRPVTLALAGGAAALFSAGGFFAWRSAGASDDISGVFASGAPWTSAAAERERDGMRDARLATGAFIAGTALTAACLWYLLR